MLAKRGGFLISLLLLFFFVSMGASWAMGKKQKKHLMGVLGDSISAATYSDTSEDALDVELAALLPSWVTSRVISQVQPLFLIENKDTYSWASGRRIQSHFMRLKKLIEEDSQGEESLDVFNAAMPGDRTRDLGKQLTKLAHVLELGKYLSLKYVTFFIGSNDACFDESGFGTPDDRMAAELKDAFKTLAGIRQSEAIRVQVSSMPQIPNLGARNFMERPTLGIFTCAVLQLKILKSCNPLLVWSTDSEYRKRMSIVETKNGLIERVALEAAQEFSNLDIHFSRHIFEQAIVPEHLAADCFHPNQLGQQVISDLLWEDQPWFG